MIQKELRLEHVFMEVLSYMLHWKASQKNYVKLYIYIYISSINKINNIEY